MAGMIDVAGVLGVVQRVALGGLVDGLRQADRSRLWSSSIAPDQLVQVSGLGLGDRGAGGLEVGDRLGDLGLVAQGRGQDHPLGDLDRQLRLDVDRLAVVLQEDLVPRVQLALAEDAVLGEQLDRLGRDQVGQAVDRVPAVGQAAAARPRCARPRCSCRR